MVNFPGKSLLFILLSLRNPNPQKKQWMINWKGLSTDDSCNAHVQDDVEHALLVSKTWKVWNGTTGSWEEDSNIKIEECSLHKAIQLED